MNSELLLKYSKENNVPVYHGIVELDTLKHLSELELPDIIKEDYTQQYEAYIYGLESKINHKLGGLLYDKFNDSVINISPDLIDSYTYENITVCALEIEIPYFEAMKQYLTQHESDCRVKSKFIVLDIRIGEISLLKNLIEKLENSKKDGRYNIFGSMFFPINNVHYALCKNFKSPYNGISSNLIPNIFRGLCEESIKNRNICRVGDYLERLLPYFASYVDISIFMERIKLIK